MPDIRDKMLTSRYGAPTLDEAMARIRLLDERLSVLELPKKRKRRKKQANEIKHPGCIGRL